MSRHRDSGRKSGDSDSYNIRWHSVANMATPSVDIMSSPDPLNDTDVSEMLQASSQRVTRSQRSSRFMSLASSPRKQTFELAVGDNASPQKLLVTVETDDGSATTMTDTRRRLFPSPSPSLSARPRVRTTTTTIPLRESIEEERETPADVLATPKRRGRPRKTNGTPIPSAIKKRRPPTPATSRTPRRARASSRSATKEPPSEISAQGTPTPKRRGRPPKVRPAEPSSDAGTASAQKPPSTTRGRRRRQALAPDELVKLADVAEDISIPDEPLPSENDVDLVRPPSSADPVPSPEPTAPAAPDAGSDIWMATMSDEATPRATRTRREVPDELPSEPVALSEDAGTSPQPEDVLQDQPADDDYGYLAPAASDVSSADEPVSQGPYRNDTIAQGEDFSMIFMDSLPSLQADLSAIPGADAEDELGDETHQIINNTLESFRQSTGQEGQSQLQEAPVEQAELGEEVDLVQTVQQEEVAETDPLVPLGQPTEFQTTAAQEDLAELEEVAAMSEPEQPIWPAQREESIELGQPAPAREDLIELQQSADTTEPAELEEAMALEEFAYLESPAEMEEQEASEDLAVVERGQADELEVLAATHQEVETDQQSASLAPAAPSPDRLMSPRLARSPRKPQSSPLRHQVLRLNARQTNDSPGPREEAVLENSASRRQSAISNVEDSNMYEDSFSEIPGDVLEAATPARRRAFTTANMEDEMDLIEQDAEANDGESMAADAEQTPASQSSGVARSDVSRLPTPDDTPPQSNDTVEDVDNLDKSSIASPAWGLESHKSQQQAEPSSESRASVRQLASVEQPSVSTERTLDPVEATPLNQLSSPVQEPQSLLLEPVQDKTRRPTLSPIVRAGRALQSVTSDPPSPENSEKQLRSPFRSSGSRESWPGARSSHGRTASSQTPPNRPGSSRAMSRSRSKSHEDPFGATSHSTGQVGFMQALNRSVHESAVDETGIDEQQEVEDGAAARTDSSSMRATPPGDEMSWVANEGPISPRLRGDVSLKEAAAAPASSQSREEHTATTAAQVDGASDEAPPTAAEPDDDLDLWEFEAQRETPRSTRQQPFGKRVAAPLRRRAAIPSPWTKRNTVLGSQIADYDTTAQTNEIEDYSLLARREPVKKPVEPPKPTRSAEKTKGLDLSSFFSSPAAIPGMLADKFRGSKRASNDAAARPPTSQGNTPAERPTTIPTSSMFPQMPEQSLEPKSARRRNMHSPIRQVATAQQEESEPQEPSPSPPTPQAPEMPSVAQKQNFTPRPKQAGGGTLFQPSSARPAAPATVTATPPRMQLSRADIQKWQQEASKADQDSPEFRRPLLRPLPPKTASPHKSSLRSPLKPRTPGRVVEFTSSVLSPMEQARVRQQQRTPSIFGSSQLGQSAGYTGAANDKENQDASDVVMTDASPLAKMRHPVPLSTTTWTRQHWLFLDELLQLRRAAPFDEEYERHADRFLGKTVKSQGDEMILERWHLDCVDAFKGEVGDWDEAVVAKRLFALILGEERRSHRPAFPPGRAVRV